MMKVIQTLFKKLMERKIKKEKRAEMIKNCLKINEYFIYMMRTILNHFATESNTLNLFFLKRRK